ncbi:hypothetical protein QL093DRAFT_1972607, partial [Fusarium oxysporum]
VFNCITNKDYLLNDGVVALLRTATYGLENAILAAPFQLEISGYAIKRNTAWGEKMSPLLPDHYWKVNCEAHLGFLSSLEARKRMHGIRFLIGSIRHNVYKQFTTFIWDRKKGKFYHFDSFLPDQMIRLSNAILGFGEFLAAIGQKFTFTYYQMPISKQPTGWECGIIASYCVIKKIHGLVGANYAEAVAVHGKKSLLIDGRPHEEPEPSDLLLCDWVLGLGDSDVSYKTKVRESPRFVKGFFQQFILMDLGVMDSKYIQHFTTAQYKQQHFTKHEPRLTIYEEHQQIHFRRMTTAPDSIEIDDLYTSEGGYLPIWSSRVGYDRKWDQHRIIPIPNAKRATLHNHIILGDLPDIVFPFNAEVRRILEGRCVSFENNAPIRPIRKWGSVSLLDNDQKEALKQDLELTKAKSPGFPRYEKVNNSEMPTSQQKPVQLFSKGKTPAAPSDQMELTSPKGPAVSQPT